MPAGAALEFVELCRRKRILFVVFVRHANAAPLREGAASRADKPHDWKEDDQMRVLTEFGRAQCNDASAWFSQLDVRAALSSPARRAADTAVRMTAATETAESKRDAVYLRVVAGVHPAGMSEPCEALFDGMGYGPLRSFFDAPGGEEAFLAYADDVCGELAAVTAAVDGGGGGVAVFGHAVFLNAIAYKVAVAAGCDEEAKDALLDMDLKETQAIHVTLEGGTVAQLP